VLGIHFTVRRHRCFEKIDRSSRETKIKNTPYLGIQENYSHGSGKIKNLKQNARCLTTMFGRPFFSPSSMPLQYARRVSATVTTIARQQQQQQQQQFRCMGHTVRIIVREDLPHGKAYQDDVIHVKAGYARNFLIPKKLAVYASRDKFKKLEMSDPDQETYEQRQARLLREASVDDKDLRAADLLRNYLRNKVVRDIYSVLFCFCWHRNSFSPPPPALKTSLALCILIVILYIYKIYLH
jgi:Ribosomal protein L9, N-terminal domain